MKAQVTLPEMTVTPKMLRRDSGSEKWPMPIGSATPKISPAIVQPAAETAARK